MTEKLVQNREIPLYSEYTIWGSLLYERFLLLQGVNGVNGKRGEVGLPGDPGEEVWGNTLKCLKGMLRLFWSIIKYNIFSL